MTILWWKPISLPAKRPAIRSLKITTAADPRRLRPAANDHSQRMAVQRLDSISPAGASTQPISMYWSTLSRPALCLMAAALSGSSILQNGERKVAQAEREVLLAGGVINSPQLLMLSGIGDPAKLGGAFHRCPSAALRRRNEPARSYQRER